MNKIDKVIQYFRNLKEEAPTMSSGDQPFSSSSNPEGPNAGLTPGMSFKRRQNGRIDGRSVAKKYKNWIDSLGM
jgi:hypothetical protein